MYVCLFHGVRVCVCVCGVSPSLPQVIVGSKLSLTGDPIFTGFGASLVSGIDVADFCLFLKCLFYVSAMTTARTYTQILHMLSLCAEIENIRD